MDDPSGIFTLIDDVAATFPPDPQRLATLLGVELLRDAAASSPVQTVWQNAPASRPGPFSSVLLRLPSGLDYSRRALLSLQLSNSRDVRRSSIIERMGPDFSLQLPSPRYAPGTVPAYLRYQRPWGWLSFGVDARGQGDLLELLLEILPAPDAEPPVPVDIDAA